MMVEDVVREIKNPCKESNRYNFYQYELDEWDDVRLWVKGLLEKRGKDCPITQKETKNGGQ
jgi:hypothetical protein